MSEAWTEERLDDLNHRVDDLGRRMDTGFDRVHAELRSLRSDTKAELASLRSEMNARFNSLQRTMVHAVLGLAGAFIAGFAALIGLIATQL